MQETNIRIISENYTLAMQQKPATEVYNLFSGRLHVTDTNEAKELLGFIQKLQGLDPGMLSILKREGV